MVAIIVLVFGFVGCKPEPDPVCECNPKEHYLPCACEVAGTDKCNCIVIPRGTVTDKAGNIVPIFQKVFGISDEMANGATKDIQDGYSGMGTDNQNAISGKMKEIWFTTQTQTFDYEFSGNRIIIKFKYDVQFLDDSFYNFMRDMFPSINFEN
jgi:hypothetical protein